MRAADDSRCIISLGASEPAAEQWAQEAGISVLRHNDGGAIADALAGADLVHLGAWNTPELYAWLASPLPPMRLVMSLHINGEFPSQVATFALLNAADWLVAATPHSLTLPSFREQIRTRAERVHAIPDTTILPETEPIATPHTGIRVGYAGTVDFVKMHPRFVELCARAASPDVTFPVAGSGNAFKTLKKQSANVPNARFEFLGYLTQVREFLATCDIFGYPLVRETYAAGELIVQEAMWLGVPPIVLAVGGLPYLVQHNETGMVAQDENEYSEMLKHLIANRSERIRLGANARAFARQNLGAHRAAPALRDVYARAMNEPKQSRSPLAMLTGTRSQGAAALIRAFGEWGEPFRVSLEDADYGAIRHAEARIAAASPLEASASAGGILDYRLHYPNDPFLRLWAGLTLGMQNHFALAAADFSAAKHFGVDSKRVEPYLERVMAHETPFKDPNCAD